MRAEAGAEEEHMTEEELAALGAETELSMVRAEEARAGAELLLYRHDHFRFDREQEAFWDLQTGQLVSADVVDNSIARVDWRREEPAARGRNAGRERLIRPSLDIKAVEAGLTVHSSTWWPGRERLIRGEIAAAAGVERLAGVTMYNTYRPPLPEPETTNADPWIEHVRELWPRAADHNYFFDYCAHMVQRPGEKCNAGIILSGSQGIGKDAALVPLKAAVGFANAQNISPDELFSSFNTHLQAVMLVVDEARSQSDDHRATTMYNVLKPLCAAPPEMLRVNAKFQSPRWIRNCVRLFITTNEVEGMFVPKDDRRLCILHSAFTRAELDAERMERYWAWVRAGGAAAVRGWLARRDLRGFDPAAPPVQTRKHAELTASWGLPEDSGLARALRLLGERRAAEGRTEAGWPRVMFIAELKEVAAGMFDGSRGAD